MHLYINKLIIRFYVICLTFNTVGAIPIAPHTVWCSANFTFVPRTRATELQNRIHTACSANDVFSTLHSDFSRKKPAVSVLIGAFQRFATLELIVSSLRRQKGVLIEIIVSDGGSNPSILASIPATAALVDKIIYRKDDGLYHRVRSFNEAAEAATHSIFILLDDDVIPAGDYWALAAFRSLDTSDAGISRMPVVIREFKDDLSDVATRKEELLSLSWANAIVTFSTWNVAIRRASWEAIGGLAWRFDGIYGNEDHDFHNRAVASGLHYTNAPPTACALHAGLFFGNRGLNKPEIGKLFPYPTVQH